jgi:hypothetical protein
VPEEEAVPLNVPVVMSKFSPGGISPAIEKLAAFIAAGVNVVYGVPRIATVAGSPDMDGGGILTVIENAGSDTEPELFMAVMTMLS